MKKKSVIILTSVILALAAVITIVLCNHYINKGYDIGYDSGSADGYELGYADGNEAGYELGYTEGHEEGHASGYRQGHDEGYSEGADSGYEAGYRSGFTSGKESEQADYDSRSDGQYCGSRNSDKYHRLDCSYVDSIDESNLVFFYSVEEAQQRGYSPCSRCNP